jgi:hypothetical protein
MGIKFLRKSPAVALTERHFPSAADFSDTEENARVALSSRWLASAAAEGLRKPPARETGIGDAVVGLDTTGGAEKQEFAVVASSAVDGVRVGDAADGDSDGDFDRDFDSLPVPGVALPKVKDWFGSAVLQEVWSMTLPLTTKQVPAEFIGVKAKGPASPVKENNWEVVTSPPT